jgi:hypothetical protein
LPFVLCGLVRVCGLDKCRSGGALLRDRGGKARVVTLDPTAAGA